MRHITICPNLFPLIKVPRAIFWEDLFSLLLVIFGQLSFWSDLFALQVFELYVFLQQTAFFLVFERILGNRYYRRSSIEDSDLRQLIFGLLGFIAAVLCIKTLSFLFLILQNFLILPFLVDVCFNFGIVVSVLDTLLKFSFVFF